jgi:hypothetical protein
MFAKLKAWFTGSGIGRLFRKSAAIAIEIVGTVGIAILEAEAERQVARWESVSAPGEDKFAAVRAILIRVAREQGIPTTRRILDKIIQDAVVALDPGDPEFDDPNKPVEVLDADPA